MATSSYHWKSCTVLFYLTASEQIIHAAFLMFWAALCARVGVLRLTTANATYDSMACVCVQHLDKGSHVPTLAQMTRRRKERKRSQVICTN